MDKEYEDLIPEIEQVLAKYRAKWQLNALTWLDYDDVCQIIRLHIYNKLHLWDQKRAFKPWASVLISNQIKNLIRNHYSNFAKPCLQCPHYSGGLDCSMTKSGVQDVSCSLFANWRKKKENAYNLKLPLSLDTSIFVYDNLYDENVDYDRKVAKIHQLVLKELSEKHKIIYTMLFMENATDEEVAKRFGFKKDTSKRKTPRYKQINNLKKKFYLIAQKVIKKDDLI
jgi:RNA polymerase sigma factor (sigma-70 family)